MPLNRTHHGMSDRPPMGSGGVLIAAANSPRWAQENATYICGNDARDDQTIIEAINDYTYGESTGITVVLAPGTYNVQQTSANSTENTTGVIPLRSNVRIVGHGRGTVMNFPASAVSGALDRYMFAGVSTTAYGITGWSVENLRIIAHAASHHGIHVSGSQHERIHNVWFEHDASVEASTDEGIQYSGDLGACRGGVVSNCYFSGFGGVSASNMEVAGGDNGITDMVVSNCYFTGGNGSGFKIRTGGTAAPARIKVIGCHAVGVATIGFNIDDSRACIIQNCGASSNGTSGFDLGSNSRNNMLIGNVAHNNDNNGFEIDGDGHHLIGNVSYNNGVDTGVAATNRTGFRQEGTNNVYIGNHAFDTNGTQTQQRGFHGGGGSSARLIGNAATSNVTNYTALTSAIVDIARIKDNAGLVTENSGTGTILSGATTATITHGISTLFTPAAFDITLTPTSSGSNDAGYMWVTGMTTGTFQAHCRADPGAANLTFSWRVRIGGV